MLPIQSQQGQSRLFAHKRARRATRDLSLSDRRITDDNPPRTDSRAEQQSMHVLGKRFGHLFPPDIRDRVQGQAIVDLVVVIQIFPDRVDHQPDQVRVFV